MILKSSPSKFLVTSSGVSFLMILLGCCFHPFPFAFGVNMVVVEAEFLFAETYATYVANSIASPFSSKDAISDLFC